MLSDRYKYSQVPGCVLLALMVAAGGFALTWLSLLSLASHASGQAGQALIAGITGLSLDVPAVEAVHTGLAVAAWVSREAAPSLVALEAGYTGRAGLAGATRQTLSPLAARQTRQSEVALVALGAASDIIGNDGVEALRTGRTGPTGHTRDTLAGGGGARPQSVDDSDIHHLALSAANKTEHFCIHRIDHPSIQEKFLSNCDYN